MTDPDISRIGALDAGELRGWYLAVFVWHIRNPVSGEMEAIYRRAKALGLEWK